ncbi:MAG: hypothetical protein P9L95_06445 [Candidatus Tenebribacter mawsonii]|nr:hypothetical protein [Candidatus Tenebribacter mawsonii]
MEKKENIKNEIWNLHRKADQTRTMHGHIKDYFSISSKIILGYVSIGSAIVAMLIFADIEEDTQFLIGIASASIFVIGLIPTTFSFESKIIERGVAVKLWGTWIRTASNFCNTEIDTLDDVDAKERANEVVEGYKTIMNETPSIPDRKFNRLKQKHLQKIEISKALDKKPFTKIKTIKSDLKAKSDKVTLA